jgi:hypothetical protein
MNFTPKTNVRPVVSGILTIAVVGLIGWVSHFGFSSAPIAATQNAFTVQESFQGDTVPAAEQAPAFGLQTGNNGNYLPISAWYKNKHWWKKNAPVVGGAAGGALIGGFVGGGKGALIGGAAGGGGGYLYKRMHHHHRHYHH